MSQSSSTTWLPPALSLLLVGWGANQFASMLAFYQDAYGYTQLTVTSMLGIYVAGLLPALLIGGRFSDRLGRRKTSVVALLTTIIASVLMIGGVWAGSFIFLGRLLAGVATGLAMAATSSWVKEFSQAPWNPNTPVGAGARRASLFTAGGFWLGPVSSGLLANFAPAPEILPYLTHIVLCLPFLIILSRLPETRLTADTGGAGRGASSPEAYPGASRRFWTIVGPGAPWVFGAGTIGFAVVPALMASLGEQLLLYSTIAVAVTLGSGVLVQPLARRLDKPDSARASLTALALSITGLLLGIGAGLWQNPWMGLLASTLLGAGYGLMLVASMLETQRTASAEHLGSAMGTYYTLAYAGFLAPTVLAFFALWFSEFALLIAVVALGVVSFVTILVNSRRHLSRPAAVGQRVPTGAEGPSGIPRTASRSAPGGPA